MHSVLYINTLDLPRIAITQPIVRNLDLKTILNHLFENAIIISYTIAPSRQVQGSK